MWTVPSSNRRSNSSEVRSTISTPNCSPFFPRRMSVAEKIGMIKKENNVTILQTSRWGEILEKVKRQSQLLNLSEEFLGKILEAIHVEST